MTWLWIVLFLVFGIICYMAGEQSGALKQWKKRQGRED